LLFLQLDNKKCSAKIDPALRREAAWAEYAKTLIIRQQGSFRQATRCRGESSDAPKT
jgi:hypothetical protein